MKNPGGLLLSFPADIVPLSTAPSRRTFTKKVVASLIAPSAVVPFIRGRTLRVSLIGIKSRTAGSKIDSH